MADTAAYVKFRDDMVALDRGRFHESVRDTLELSQVLYAQCQRYTEALVKAFPELKADKGFYCHPDHVDQHTPGTEHWWCVCPDGTIYDPTVEQFGPGGVHVSLRPDFHHVRLGACMACGMDILGLGSLGHRMVCIDSPECHEILEREYSFE